MMNDWSTSRVEKEVETKLCKAKENEKLHYSVNLGVQSKHSIIVRLLAALFFSQRGLKALENQMFKLAGEGIYNNFPSEKYCTLHKVLHAEAMHCRPAGKLEVFSEECFKDIHVFNKTVFLSGILYCYNPLVRRGAI